MDFIFIEELRVKACVGIYEREKTGRQTVELNLTFGVPDAAAEHDDIADTIDYAVVTERIRRELAERHFNLIESLGEFVVTLLFEQFGAPWVKLKVGKSGDVLEAGSGTGQHVVQFASQHPDITWWPSDANERHLASIAAWRAHADLPNIRPPI